MPVCCSQRHPHHTEIPSGASVTSVNVMHLLMKARLLDWRAEFGDQGSWLMAAAGLGQGTKSSAQPWVSLVPVPDCLHTTHLPTLWGCLSRLLGSITEAMPWVNRECWEAFALSKFLICEKSYGNYTDADGQLVSCQEVPLGHQKSQFLKLAKKSNLFGC